MSTSSFWLIWLSFLPCFRKMVTDSSENGHGPVHETTLSSRSGVVSVKKLHRRQEAAWSPRNCQRHLDIWRWAALSDWRILRRSASSSQRPHIRKTRTNPLFPFRTVWSRRHILKFLPKFPKFYQNSSKFLPSSSRFLNGFACLVLATGHYLNIVEYFSAIIFEPTGVKLSYNELFYDNLSQCKTLRVGDCETLWANL